MLPQRLIDGDFRLIIVDSIIALFRAEFVGRGELAERQQALQRMLNQFNKLVYGMSGQGHLRAAC